MKQDDKDTRDNKLNSLEEPTPELKEELSSIATTTKQKFLIWSILGLIGSYLLFYFYVFKKNPSGNTTITDSNAKNNVARPSQIADDVDVIPQLPSIPKLYEPTPIVQPPPPPPTIVKVLPAQVVLPPPPLPTNNDGTAALPKIEQIASKIDGGDDEQKRRDAKRKSGIMLVSGRPIGKTDEQIKQEADFIRRGDLSLLLPRGKVIDAVIETALNSDFGGDIKAIVSKDVYAASGNKILIPKGSTIFGNYDSTFQQSYARVEVIWTRIDLAHSNYGINISSPSIDNLGRKGVAGHMDNKYKEKISNAILSSAFNILLASGLDKMVPPVVNSVIGGAGNQTSATQINNLATNIFADPTQTAVQKITNICAQVQGAIMDKTSSAYVTFSATCASIASDIQTDATRAPADLNTLMAAVYTASSSLVTAGGFVNPQIMTTPTQVQQASKQAYNDIGNTMKEIIVQQLPKATVTVDQGTHVKIYVNKDYNFPRAALNKMTNINCQ